METLFVAGSIAIKQLDPEVVTRIGTAVNKGMAIVVGDADGADTAIQQALLDVGATNVTVFCSGRTPRNNLGDWPVHQVFPDARPGSRAWFTAKDQAMAEAGDYGLMIWDARSTGTLTNVLELVARGRTSVVFVARDRKFMTVSDADGIDRLTALMTPSAIEQAERKMGLKRRRAALCEGQIALAL